MHDPHQEFFDKLAAEWDKTFTAEDLERLQHLVDSLEVDEGMDIIDIGCGTGVLFDMLRRQVGPGGSVTGVDFSIEMVRVAHRNFPFENVNVVDADVSNLPFVDSVFDMAVSFAAFPHFAQKQKALKEISRVLRRDARYYIIHLESSTDLAKMHQRIGGVVAEDRLPSEDELREMFEHSHFSDVNIEDHTGLYLASAVNTK
ncbi:methyltransferase domain-containing protein [candidate division GN15 bacterium]|nr:methyltransferase domain-containing protein [candidate division GN15 bacterium]